jgi:SUKH-4 immunity protein
VTETPNVTQAFPPDVVKDLPIPEAAQDVLATVGLPMDDEFFAAVDVPEVMPDGTVRIGTDDGADICVDAQGRVRSISAAGEHPERFVNSDLAAFVQSLELVTRRRAEYAGQSEDVLDEQMEDMAVALVDIDEVVFDDPENWWSVIFEQMRNGLL